MCCTGLGIFFSSKECPVSHQISKFDYKPEEWKRDDEKSIYDEKG